MAKVGRPRKYNSSDELQDMIEEYFEYIEGESHEEQVRDEEGNIQTKTVFDRWPEPPTITGLALFLGFVSRQSILDYEKDGEFSCTIKTARLRVEHHYEKSLNSKTPTGAIFALKNFGWSDKVDINNNHSGSINNVISLGSGKKPNYE